MVGDTALGNRTSGVALLWAPEGPGWNWHPLRGKGRYPSWDDLALYGAPPVGIHPERKLEEGQHATEADMRATGLCRYLSADGMTLLLEPQDVWRMPTPDEAPIYYLANCQCHLRARHLLTICI